MTTHSILTLARRMRRDDQGFALPTVFMLSIVMLILATTALTVAASGMIKTRTDQDWNAALAAAYAGVADYQARLSNDINYYRYGNKNAPYTIATGSAASVTDPSPSNDAFGVGTTGTWASVPVAPGDPTTTYYRYEIDNTDYLTTGVLHVRSTGRSNNVTRSVVADVKQSGFLNYLYFTDYEVQDPAYNGYAAVDSNGTSVCERHAYDSPTRPTSEAPYGCGVIQFGPNDSFSGPVRSNDRLTICGATFKDSVISAAPASSLYTKPSGCSNPTFAAPPVHQDAITMPPTNTQLKAETRNDTPTTVPSPGCLYTGPTQISFEIVNGVGKMRVLSPWTKFTNTGATANDATNPAKCGTPGTGTNGLGSTTGALLDVLDLNLIYVQAVPAAGSGDANAWPGVASQTITKDQTIPTNVACVNAVGGGTDTPAGWSYSYTSGGKKVYAARYPLDKENTPSGATSLVHYGCKAGDVYVEGTLDGRTSIAAENYIYVTGDLTYVSRTDDLLGLIGQNAVFVWNPMDDNTSLLGGTDREIDAAILSVAHTFQVQNYDEGSSRGTLTVFGAIAQKYRGTVAKTSGSSILSGYAKDYQYDRRLMAVSPPKFLSPASTTFETTQYSEVAPGFTSTGATAP